MWTKKLATLAWLGALLAAPARADAAEPPIDVAIDPCVRVEPGTVERIVRIELGAARGAREDARVTHVAVQCRGDDVTLHLDDPVTGKSLDRTIEASALVGVSSSRLLALAIVELVSASWVELVVTPSPQPAPVAPRVSEEVRRSARERVDEKLAPPRRATSVRAGTSLRAIDGGVGPLAGGVLALAHDFGSWRLRADVSGLTGTSARSLGEVRATLVDGSLAFAFAPRFGALSLYAGVGARFGAAWLAGQPNAGLPAGGTVAGVVGGPLACVGASASARWLLVALDFEAGWAALGVRGLVDGASPVDLLGGWIGGSAQIGVAF